VLLIGSSLALPAVRTRRAADGDDNDVKAEDETPKEEDAEKKDEKTDSERSIPDAITTYPLFPEHLLPLLAPKDSEEGPALTPGSAPPDSDMEKAGYAYISSVNHLYNPQPVYSHQYYYQPQPAAYHHSYVMHPSEAWQANIWAGNTWQPQMQPAYPHYYPQVEPVQSHFGYWPQTAGNGFTYVIGHGQQPMMPMPMPMPEAPPAGDDGTPPKAEDREEVTMIDPKVVNPNERIEMSKSSDYEDLGQDESNKKENQAAAEESESSDTPVGPEERKR